jgi:hypothetical protein
MTTFPFLTAALENRYAHGLFACEIAPIMACLAARSIFARTKMIRAVASMLAVVTLLAGAGQARAQGFDLLRDILGGSPDYNAGGLGGSSPIPRQTVSFASNYAPGTIYINTAERRLYLVLPNGQALRYGIGVGRDGFRWGGVHRISAKKEWPSWTPPSQMLARGGPICRATWRAASTIRWARAPYIWDRRCIAFTAPTSRRRSARRCPPAASA